MVDSKVTAQVYRKGSIAHQTTPLLVLAKLAKDSVPARFSLLTHLNFSYTKQFIFKGQMLLVRKKTTTIKYIFVIDLSFGRFFPSCVWC